MYVCRYPKDLSSHCHHESRHVRQVLPRAFSKLHQHLALIIRCFLDKAEGIEKINRKDKARGG